MSEGYAILVIGVMSAISLFLRAFPFLFMEVYKTNGIITYLGSVLPASVMIILVYYSLQGVNFSVHPYGAPEVIAIILVTILHVLKRNIFISIGIGTFAYATLNLIMLGKT